MIEGYPQNSKNDRSLNLSPLQNMVEYMSMWRGTRYWCDGVLTLAVGGVGFVGNIFSILILSSRSGNVLLTRLTQPHIMRHACTL